MSVRLLLITANQCMETTARTTWKLILELYSPDLTVGTSGRRLGTSRAWRRKEVCKDRFRS